MLDAPIRRLIDGPLARAGGRLAALEVRANTLTWAGFAVGAAGCLAIALGSPLLGLILFLANRLADGLDGAVARVVGPTDRGAFLDIILDFLVYSGMAFAFAARDPEANGLAAAALIYSFIGTGCSFLAYAIIAAKRNLTTERRGKKSIFYLGGLAEGTETILVFTAMCLWPALFVPLAWAFAAICWITTASRIHEGVTRFR